MTNLILLNIYKSKFSLGNEVMLVDRHKLDLSSKWYSPLSFLQHIYTIFLAQKYLIIFNRYSNIDSNAHECGN